MYIMTQYNQVKTFMQLAGQTVNTTSTALTYKQAEFRKTLIQEELFGANELIDSMKKEDRKGILDGICDVLYVVYGALASYGLAPYDYNVQDADQNSSNIPTSGAVHRFIKQLTGDFERYCRGAECDDNQEIYSACDSIIYTMLEIGKAYKLDIMGAFEEVHSSNMSKFSTDIESAEESINKSSFINSNYEGAGIEKVVSADDKVYYIIKRKGDGKILKPTSFFEPNLDKFI